MLATVDGFRLSPHFSDCPRVALSSARIPLIAARPSFSGNSRLQLPVEEQRGWGAKFMRFHLQLELGDYASPNDSLTFFSNGSLLTCPQIRCRDPRRVKVCSKTIIAASSLLASSYPRERAGIKKGTRMWRRGADSDGFVANFVETEQIAQLHGNTTSYVQLSSHNEMENREVPGEMTAEISDSASQVQSSNSSTIDSELVAEATTASVCGCSSGSQIFPLGDNRKTPEDMRFH